MQLDSTRNHIMIVNLWVSMISISVMSTTIVPCFFGMNVTHGFPDQPWAFYGLCCMSVVLAAISFPVARYYFIRNWQKHSQKEITDMKTLRY